MEHQERLNAKRYYGCVFYMRRVVVFICMYLLYIWLHSEFGTYINEAGSELCVGIVKTVVIICTFVFLQPNHRAYVACKLTNVSSAHITYVLYTFVEEIC